ncbi:SGNH/GDSL hydrolase family protein [Actinocorallia libanotica]|uniref:SGNH/GDSL hydrolase family protein n=1 Tax=Actinocorallia libanotica TaxID=46162 RepID=A0ABN1RGU5_9ACTN
MHTPRSAKTLVPVFAALALTAALQAPAEADTAFQKYVALGDSYASGPGIPTQVVPGCERSDHNYAHVLAEALEPAEFTDATCGGATTAALTTSQKEGVPPQLDAVTADTDLVTLTIGGNDVGFVDIFTSCALLTFGEWWSNPCQKRYTAGGTDQMEAKIAATAPKIDSAIRAIRARAPQAEIVVTGYLRIVPDSGGCWPALPFAPGDVPWLAAKQRSLNQMIKSRAEANGAVGVDPFQASTGHDACKSAAVRWTEPSLGSATSPAHPNANGMAAVANLIEDALGA